MQESRYNRCLSVTQAVHQFRVVPEKHIAQRKMESFLVQRRGTRSERRNLHHGIIPEWAQTEAALLLDYDRKSPHGFTAALGWQPLAKLALAA